MQLDKSSNEMQLFTVNFCCGIGGESLGISESNHEYKGIHGKFKNICGFDVDPVACKYYERITGNTAICTDLFSKEQYTMFHGQEPSPEWKEITGSDIRKYCKGIYPDMIFMSPPCKGNSRLLPPKMAMTPKYQALNMLPERIVDLVLDAWFDDLPAVLMIENVPGILDKNRGLNTLKKIKNRLALRGYVFYEDLYDCGEWGGLGQHRVRYILIARLPSKISSFIFQPQKLPLKSIGDILGPLPMPGDTIRAGKMHHIPRLQWKTWERLALIPAGKDWRALENFGHKQWAGAWRIVPWDETSNTVTAATKGVGTSTGVSAVADPRLQFVQGYGNKYRVVSSDEPCPTVTGSRVGSGAMIYADPKVPKFAANANKVIPWNDPSGTVTGGAGVSNGGIVIADPRLNQRENRHPGTYKVIPWDKPSNTVTGQVDVQTGALNVSDPRLGCKQHSGTMGVIPWDETAKTITSGNIYNGTSAVADPRIPYCNERGIYIIIALDGTWHRPITTYEMAMLQGFPRTMKDGSPFELVGCSDGKAREYIGNAVPVQTATAIGNMLLETMMPNMLGDWHWGFSDDMIWVQPQYDYNNTVNVTVQ